MEVCMQHSKANVSSWGHKINALFRYRKTALCAVMHLQISNMLTIDSLEMARTSHRCLSVGKKTICMPHMWGHVIVARVITSIHFCSITARTL